VKEVFEGFSSHDAFAKELLKQMKKKAKKLD
jgi:hypothetical protein